MSALEPGPIVVTSARKTVFDAILWTAGVAAAPMLRESGLAVDAAGFARVDASLRSVSHPAVFAAGDAASLEGTSVPKSGVHALREGAVLAENLTRVLRGKDLVAYEPQRHSPLLLSCGGKYAIATRGGWSAEGAWAWRWKDWIDRRWVSRFRWAALPAFTVTITDIFATICLLKIEAYAVA